MLTAEASRAVSIAIRLAQDTDPGATAAATNMALKCKMSTGYGAGLRFSYSIGSAKGLGTRRGQQVFQYASPVVVDGSLRLVGETYIKPVVLTSVLGGTLHMDLEVQSYNLSSVPLAGGELFVNYGPSDDPTRYTCKVKEVAATSLTCNAEPGEGTEDMRFTVTLGGVSSLPSNDTLRYPAAPVVLNVSGCKAPTALTGFERGEVQRLTTSRSPLLLSGTTFCNTEGAVIHVTGRPCFDGADGLAGTVIN